MTEADVLILDLKRKKNVPRHLFIARGYESEIGLLRALRSKWSEPDSIPVHVLSMSSFRRSFHMTEDEYINIILEKEKNK